METREVQLRVGVGGWEHDEFDRMLYSRPGLTQAEKLKEYSRYFDCVEVRPTFWDGSLSADDAREWITAVSGKKTFLFTVKLHSAFTHAREYRSQIAKNTRGLLQELSRANRLGALLMQFPYSFTNTGSNRAHLVRLSEVFNGFPIDVELRHASWNQPSLPGFLEEHSLLQVSADLPRVRQYMPFLSPARGENAYVRLHGRNEKGWLLSSFDTRYDYLYNSRELREIVRRLEGVSERCRQISLIFNNTTRGKALANAFQLQAAWRKDRTRVAPGSLQAFPQLGEIALSPEPSESLFTEHEYREAM
jgi:uncharacterized protein YecE (DUF72 family)